MRSLICVMLAGVLVGGATIAADRAEAGPKRRNNDRHERYDHDRYDRDRHDDDGYRRGGDRRGGYFSTRHVRVIREYYGPYYRPGGHRVRYYRSGYLPHGWHHRMRPIPVYVERELVVLPHGYHRGLIDGHAVVYNSRGLIVDVAFLF